MKNYEKVFESERITFAYPSPDYVDDYLEMINNPEIYKHLSHNLQRTYTREQELEWINSKLDKKATCYMMLEKDTGEFIGNIEIVHVKDGTGEIGIVITAKKQDMHYGSEALKSLIDYGYNVLKLDGFDLHVHFDNPRAKHVYEKLGFESTGIHMVYKKPEET